MELIKYRIEARSHGRALLVVECAASTTKECRFGLSLATASAPTWQWDGNAQTPTITPSIHCATCQRHWSITAGVVQQ